MSTFDNNYVWLKNRKLSGTKRKSSTFTPIITIHLSVMGRGINRAYISNILGNSIQWFWIFVKCPIFMYRNLFRSRNIFKIFPEITRCHWYWKIQHSYNEIMNLNLLDSKNGEIQNLRKFFVNIGYF